MAKDKVITAPLAIIRVQGVAIGKMRGLRINENIQRGNVQGIGRLTSDEKPALSFAGTVTCDAYNVSFDKSLIPDAVTRVVQTVEEFTDSILLQEEGVTLEIYRKVAKAGSPTKGKIASEEKVFAIIRGLFLDAESFDLNEGAISGKNQSFQYMEPIIYPK